MCRTLAYQYITFQTTWTDKLATKDAVVIMLINRETRGFKIGQEIILPNGLIRTQLVSPFKTNNGSSLLLSLGISDEFPLFRGIFPCEHIYLHYLCVLRIHCCRNDNTDPVLFIMCIKEN